MNLTVSADLKSSYYGQRLFHYFSVMSSPRLETVISAVEGFSHLLSKQQSLIPSFIESGVLPSILSYLESNSLELQLAAVRVFINVTAGICNDLYQPRLLVNALFKCVQSSSSQLLIYQCIVVLGNIALNSLHMRNLIISLGMTSLLISVLEKSHSSSTSATTSDCSITNVVWSLSALLVRKPLPKADVISTLLSSLSLLLHHKTKAVVINALWGLFYISESTDPSHTELLLNSGSLHQLVQLLPTSTDTQIPVLRTLCNLLSSSNSALDLLLTFSFLPTLHSLLALDNPTLDCDVLRVISNVTAGTSFFL
ncbi:hypothetical protein GEMRC1_000250 [Eukaryota sp. GEM-RC1]